MNVVMLDLFGERSAAESVRHPLRKLRGPEHRQKEKQMSWRYPAHQDLVVWPACKHSLTLLPGRLPTQVPEWMPDARRFAALAGEVEHDDIHWMLRPTSEVGTTQIAAPSATCDCPAPQGGDRPS